MSNTLTNLIPTIYDATNVVSRELTGLIAAVTIDAGAENVGLGQTVTSPVAPAATAQDATPSMTIGASGGDQTIGNKQRTITKSRMVPVNWTGEEELALKDTQRQILVDQFAEAQRTIINEVEADLAALYYQASRAYGTPGTTPFATAGDFSDLAQVVKILKDNGAPQSDIQLVLDTAAGANLFGKYSRADIVGEGELRKIQQQGIILSQQGCTIRESAQIKSVTKGTGSGYLVNNAGGYSKGASTIAVDTGNGTILAGDILTATGDTNKYVNGSALSGGSLTLNLPGLQKTLADNVALTVGNSYTANMCFSRSAMHLLARTPAMPSTGDAAKDVIYVTDPASGLVFQIAMYVGQRMVQFQVGLAWGVSCPKSEHMALLLG